MKIDPAKLEKSSIVYEIQKDTETAINFAILVSIVVFGITILLNISLFPLKEIKVKNIVFSKTSENIFETVPAKKFNDEVIIETLKNYVYYRETFPKNQEDSLRFFENDEILKGREKIQIKFLTTINEVFVFKRDIKFNSINFLSKGSVKANITLNDNYIITQKSKPESNANKYEIVIKYNFQSQKIKEKNKYINPLGLKITNYEIKKI